MKILEEKTSGASHKCEKCSFSIDHHQDLSLTYDSILKQWNHMDKNNDEQKIFFEIVNYIAGFVQKLHDETDIGTK